MLLQECVRQAPLEGGPLSTGPPEGGAGAGRVGGTRGGGGGGGGGGDIKVRMRGREGQRRQVRLRARQLILGG